MLGTFKLRLLSVIIIAAIAGLAMQSDNKSRDIVEPVLRLVMQDYGINDQITKFFSQIGRKEPESVPAGATLRVQVPCEFEGLISNYGWYWSQSLGRQEFQPGVYLKVKENSTVKPILPGEVVELSRQDKGHSILIKHDSGLYSRYGGLKEVLVEKGSMVSLDKTLGKTYTSLYFELRNQDGPLNPHKIFE
ncbi:MAG: peptidoglycan DD-metalloendopeptidase family protein [Syntrophomonadaceae bacterium]